MAALTAALITVNWGIYVWAIAADRTLETALGYYINPLFSVVLGRRPARRKAEPGADRRDRRWLLSAVAMLTFGDGRAALGVAGAGALLGFLRLLQARRCRSARARASSSKC